MSHALRGAAAIVGIGATRFGELPGRTHTENMSEAVHLALADAGLSKDRIDGVFGADFTDSMVGLSMTEYFGLNPKYIDSTNLGGSSFVNFLQSAALALHVWEGGLAMLGLVGFYTTAGGAVVAWCAAGLLPPPAAKGAIALLPPSVAALLGQQHQYAEMADKEEDDEEDGIEAPSAKPDQEEDVEEEGTSNVYFSLVSH